MPIKIYSDRIELGDKVITATPTGIRIDDSLLANTQNVRVGSTNFTARELAYGSETFQGSSFGYSSGGYGPPTTNTIDKFPFASNTNATDVGDLTAVKRYAMGQSSSTNGYAAGGTPAISAIDKFPFATNTNAVSVGNLTMQKHQGSGQSSKTAGYASAGSTPVGTTTNNIDKFPFVSDTNATDIGDLTVTRYSTAGQSSTNNGYTSGGSPSEPAATPPTNTIDKFPFATDTNATDVGDLTQARWGPMGQSSTTHGYSSGSLTFPPEIGTNTIDKFPFAADTNATDVGDLTQARGVGGGQSSTNSGYVSGGYTGPPPGFKNTIDKFPFATDTNATDVGDLTQTRYGIAGQQV